MLQNISNGCLFIDVICSAALSIAEILQIIHIFDCKSSTLFATTLPEFLCRQSASLFDASIHFCANFHAWKSHLKLAEPKQPVADGSSQLNENFFSEWVVFAVFVLIEAV